MCRFLIYKSRHIVRMADVVTEPKHSIIRQSYSSVENKMHNELPDNLNGDGFGVGWYATEPTSDTCPCVFTSTQPAWNNRNLSRLALKVHAHLFFAHIRAASTGLGVNDANCHPFALGPFLFMHNGGISDFKTIKRKLIMCMAEEAFQCLEGSTDSECAFALFYSFIAPALLDDTSPALPPSSSSSLPSSSSSSTTTTTASPPPPPLLQSSRRRQRRPTVKEMETAMLKVIETVLRVRRECGLTAPATSSLNMAVTDGENVVVTRFVETEEREPASLYFTVGTRFAPDGQGDYEMRNIDRREESVIIASERLTSCHEDWVAVPRNTIVTIAANCTVHLKPIRIHNPG